MRSRFVAAIAVLSVSLGVGVTNAGAQVAPGDPGVKVVASGLDNPRGLDWGPFGTLFVAEAGRGGPSEGPDAICVPGPFSPTTCLGPTGAITLITPFGPHFRVVQGLPSLAVEEPGVEGTFALGPSDVSLGLFGLFFSVGGPGEDLTRSVFTPAFAQSLGTVQVATFGGSRTVADLAAFELANDPDKQLHESNVQGVLAARSGLYAIDSAGNTFFKVGLGGNLELLHVFENGTLSDGTEFQAVPSALAEGPDGAIYISTLTGVPFPAGEAKVYRWTRQTGVEVFAEGFTSAVDLAFGPDGSLYVVEIFPGDVVRVAPDGSREVVVSGLNNPTGITIARDGSIYVSNCGTCAGTGEVLKFPPAS